VTLRHQIVWTYKAWRSGVDAEVICTSDADEFCRTTPAPDSGCDCEEYVGVARDEQGWYHVVDTFDEDDNEVKLKHRHVPADECNIALYLNADSEATIMEACVDHNTEVAIGSTSIEPEWAKEGYYAWRPIREPRG
jgi:hypothetical protein